MFPAATTTGSIQWMNTEQSNNNLISEINEEDKHENGKVLKNIADVENEYLTLVKENSRELAVSFRERESSMVAL